jgi:hypothetical protein
MKSIVYAAVLASVLAAPVASFAQSNEPVTRAQVRAELIQLEKAGYNPASSNDASYPNDIQAAEQRVQAQNPAVAQAADTSGYGPQVRGAAQSGGPAKAAGPGSVYFGH